MPDTQPSGEQVFMDLGDFVPEVYDWGFTFDGRKYQFHYEEITVDDMLRIIDAAEPTDHYTIVARKSVIEFLRKVCVQGDPSQLAMDLGKMPYKREGLCIEFLFKKINQRIKKNSLGEPTKEAV